MLGEGGGDLLIDGPLGEASKNDVLSGGEGDDILIGDHVPAVKDIVSCRGRRRLREGAGRPRF